MERILELIQYNEYKWPICADLKVVAILMGLKPDFAKHQCFLCLWEGEKKELQYNDIYKLQTRWRIQLGMEFPLLPELVPADKIILPPLCIKLDIVQNFTRVLRRDGEAFKCLVDILQKVGVSADKVDNGKLNSNCIYFRNYFLAFFSSFLLVLQVISLDLRLEHSLTIGNSRIS